jgi:hypothetical protein
MTNFIAVINAGSVKFAAVGFSMRVQKHGRPMQIDRQRVVSAGRRSTLGNLDCRSRLSRAQRWPLIASSAGCFSGPDFCLIFAPCRYDDPEILPK